MFRLYRSPSRGLRLRGAACSLLMMLAVVAVPAQASPPQVVVSVPPLHSLAAAVMAGVAEPRLLLTGSVSPHAWSMRPSQARALNSADLVVWVGPDLERALTRTHEASTHPLRWLAMMEIADIHLLPRREASGEEEHGHHDSHADHDKHDHDKHDHDSNLHEAEHEAEHGHEGHEHTGDFDPHLWLDPDNAIRFVRAFAARLTELKPEFSVQFATNTANTVAALEALKLRLKAKAGQWHGGGYAVYHDAYQYLENFLGLHEPVIVTVDPDQPRGARQVSRLNEQLVHEKVKCLYTEPQFDGALVKSLADSLTLRIGVLDPLGSTLTPGPQAYEQLLTSLVDTIHECKQAAS